MIKNIIPPWSKLEISGRNVSPKNNRHLLRYVVFFNLFNLQRQKALCS